MDQKPLDNPLLSNACDDWLDSLLDMAHAEQVKALDRLAETEPELARSLRAAVLDDVLGSGKLAPFAGEDAKSGDQIGAWTLRDLIAEGGMGAVWRGIRSDGEFEQVVAIKILPGSLSTASTRQRFERERQLLAGLRHPGIAALYDGGLTEQNHLWFALEFIPGTPLTDYCLEMALSVDARLALFLEVCEAVAYAHERGVVHRDLKPHNILVEDQPSGPRVVLLDFGIAGQEAASSKLTMTGLVMGTPGYMSPEQARGDMDSVDRRSDVFALGIVLFELLGKQHPFEADTPSETIYAILHQEPRSLSGTQLPHDLLAILSHCLEKDPGLRYSSVVALGRDVRAYLKGELISVRMPGLWRRWRRKILRRPMVSAIVGVSLIASISVVISASWWSIQQSRRSAADIALVEEVSIRSQTMRDQVRLAFMRPAHNVEPQLASARLEFAALRELVSQAETSSGASLKVSLGISAQLLDLPLVAKELLSDAWRAGNRNKALFPALIESYTVLYFAEVNKARLISDEATSVAAVNRAQEKYLFPAQALMQQNSDVDTTLLKAYSALLNEHYDEALAFSRQAKEQLDWPWPAWQVEAQVWADREKIQVNLGNLDLARSNHAQASRVLDQAAEFARSLPVIAARQCQLDANLVYLTELHDLEGGVYVAPGCERLNLLSPGEELHRALVAIAYEKAANRMLRFAKAPGYLLERARELIGDGELTTVDGFYARGLVDGIEGEQRYLGGEDSTSQLLSAARSYESALEVDPWRTDIRAELSWALTLAGVITSVNGKESEPHFLRSHAVWSGLMRQPSPPLIAVEMQVVNLVEWSLRAWANGESRESELIDMIAVVDATIVANPDNKSFYYTLGTLQSNLATEAFWSGRDPTANAEQSLAAFEVYFEDVSSFAAQDVLLATLIYAAQYRHDRLQAYDRAALIQQKGQAMLGDEGGLVEMSLVLIKAGILQMAAEEAAISGVSPIKDLTRARELFAMIPESDNSYPRALTAYARALWFEYRWRFANEAVNCQALSAAAIDLQTRISGHNPRPFARTYLLQLFHEIPLQHECRNKPGLGQGLIHEHWRLLREEHPIIAADLGARYADKLQSTSIE